MQARQNPPAGWVCTFCHSTLSSLLALSSVFTGVQRGQRHPIQLPGAVPVGVLLHSGHAAGSGCSVCVCVWMWPKTHRRAPDPATQPSHLHTHKAPSQGSRFPCWELSQLGVQGHTPKGCRKKRSLGLWWTHLERGSSSLRAPMCTDLCGPGLAPPAPPSLPPSCILTQQEPGASSI